jgi:hypothetical protein
MRLRKGRRPMIFIKNFSSGSNTVLRISSVIELAKTFSEVWGFVESPDRLWRLVPTVSAFSSIPIDNASYSISETHSILFFQEQYYGVLRINAKRAMWVMSNAPGQPGVFSCPHTVVYRVEPKGKKALLYFSCIVKLSRALSIPLVRGVVQFIIRIETVRFLSRIKSSIESRS